MEILKALKGGTAALNAIHKEMSVDDVERLLEESAEAIEVRCAVVCTQCISLSVNINRSDAKPNRQFNRGAIQR